MGDLESIEVEYEKIRDIRLGVSAISGLLIGGSSLYGSFDLVEMNLFDYIVAISDITEIGFIGTFMISPLVSKSYNSVRGFVSKLR